MDRLTEVRILLERFRLDNPKIKMASPYLTTVILEKSKGYSSDVSGWVDLFKRVHIYSIYFENTYDSFAYFVLAHELVHVYQYRNLFTMLWTKTFGRDAAEAEANQIAELAEKQILAYNKGVS